jgi:hypothetical protein
MKDRLGVVFAEVERTRLLIPPGSPGLIPYSPLVYRRESENPNPPE